MISIEKGREWLRIDGDDNDAIIKDLLAAVPDYIEVATGLNVEDQEKEPLVETVSKFLLMLWYHSGQLDADRLQRTIDSLLKALAAKARKPTTYNNGSELKFNG